MSGCQFDGFFSKSSDSTDSSAVNFAPQISGTAATAVTAGQAYQFTPSATDPDGEAISFSISNKPAWASFSGSSGTLTGQPDLSAVGTYADIVISVSDGSASTSMQPFAIAVLPAGTVTSAPQAPTTGNGTASLSWSVPTENADGTPLTNLVGYRVYHGTSTAALSDVREITGAAVTQYLFESLASGTHFFAITALNSLGAESSLSGIGSKFIP